jgi:hypothetical protein
MSSRYQDVPAPQRNWALTILLLPGIVWQWMMYTFPGRGRLVRDTRKAQSAAMTWVYAAIFYGSLYLVFHFLGSK